MPVLANKPKLAAAVCTSVMHCGHSASVAASRTATLNVRVDLGTVRPHADYVFAMYLNEHSESGSPAAAKAKGEPATHFRTRHCTGTAKALGTVASVTAGPYPPSRSIESARLILIGCRRWYARPVALCGSDKS
jgi:hypothetical protein